MDLPVILQAIAVATVLMVLVVAMACIPDMVSQRRLFRSLAQQECPACHSRFGIEAVRLGNEWWSDGKTCRLVTCVACNQKWVLRHNDKGENFGPKYQILKPRLHMSTENRNTFESEECLVQVNSEHLLYTEKDVEREVERVDFRNIARVRIHRKKLDAQVYKITYRMKGKIISSQIDGFADSDMNSIAALLRARATEFSIPITDLGAHETGAP